MLKTKYEFITFQKVADKPKTTVWVCINNKSKDRLGMVGYFPGWHQYCYSPFFDTSYSAGCLRDIAEFMENLRKSEQEKKP